MAEGSVATATRHRIWQAVACVAVIAVCALILGLNGKDVSTSWTVALTVISALAGAILGNVVRSDLSSNVFRNQARPATRHLFDQVRRLQGLVVRVEEYGARITTEPIESHRASDWFNAIGNELRSEIDATATAIDNWSDLASDVREDEWQKYLDRESNLPEARKDAANG